jgi:tetratricopeptide (TPR) repeat protein
MAKHENAAMKPDSRRCRSAEELDQYARRALSPEQQVELSQHLAGCVRCSDALSALLARDTRAYSPSQADTRENPAAPSSDPTGPASLAADVVSNDTRMDQTPPPLIPHTAVARPQLGAKPLPNIPGYEVLGRCGQGGMGEVYQARDVRLGRLVALKMIFAQHASGQHLTRFKAEAQTLARLQHSHIVQIFEIGEHDEKPFLALEFLEGGTLADRLEGKPQPPTAAARQVETLARTMHAAHQQGIIHRDLKPSNILLTRDGQPKISDFGLAKQLDEDSTLTRSGALLGTPAYMAPEQAMGDIKAVGPAADVHALGAILYEMLTGRAPFRGSSVMDTLDMVRSLEPLPPHRLQPDIPRDLETICLKCLEKSPAKRYVSALALAEDLERFLAHKPIAARRAGPWERAQKWTRRHPAAAALIATIVLALVAVGALGVWSNIRLRQAAQHADERSRLARHVVDDMYTKVAEEWLAEEPYKDPLRQEFLEKALKLYQQFVADGADDPELRREIALAWFRMGQIYRTLERSTDAKQAYDRAIELQDALRTQFPANPVYRQDLANTYNWRGELLREGGRPLTEAEPNYRMAIDLQEALLKETPDQAELVKELARSNYNLGIVRLEQDQLAEAQVFLERAIGLLDDLRVKDAEAADLRQELARCFINRGVLHKEKKQFALADSDYRKAIELLEGLKSAGRFRVVYKRDLAVAYQNAGNLHLVRNELPDALRDFKQAVQLLQRLVDDFPDRPAYRKKLANSLNSLAAAQAFAKDWASAEKTWTSAREHLERLCREHPGMADHEKYLGQTLGNLGWLSTEKKDWRGARPLLKQAIQHLQIALKQNPQNAQNLHALRNQYQTLAETLIQLGEHSPAADAANALPEVRRDQAQDFYYAACFLARCASLAARDERLMENERKRISEQYVSQAILHLRQACQKGGQALQRLKIETEVFQPLHAHPEFKEVLRKLDASK